MAGGSGEDDGGGDDGDGDEGEKDKDANDSDDDKNGKDKGGKEKPKDEFVSRAEFERLRTHLSQSDKKKAAAEAELAQLKSKDLPEAEKLKADLEEATQKANAASERFNGMARTNAFLIASSKAGISWQDPKVAFKVGDFDDLVIDDDGDVIGMADAVKKLAKEHGYLVKPKVTDGEDEDDKKPIKSGSSVGTKGTGSKGKTKLSDEELRKRFPALR